MIEPRRNKAGDIVPTFVLPPNATLPNGVWPSTILGCKLTAKGLGAQGRPQ